MKPWRSVDVVIVGGGLVGSAVAVHLAHRGIEALVLDRAVEPDRKVCGEGLMPRGRAELDALGVDATAAAGVPFVGIRWILPDQAAGARFPSGLPGWGLRRDRLDPLVRAVAARAADCESNVRVTGLRGPGRVGTERGDVVARLVIGADGLQSVMRRSAGLGCAATPRPRLGARQHWRVRQPVPDHVEVVAAPWGEAYLTPVGPDQLNVAWLVDAGIVRGLGPDRNARLVAMARALPRVADLLHGAEPIDALSLAGPLRQRARAVVGDRMVLVGDAAGFVDGVTGEGMSLGLASARVLSRIVADAFARHATAPDVGRWSAEHRTLTRDHTRFTELVLWWLRHPWLTRRVVRRFRDRPDLFARILGLHDGSSTAVAAGCAALRAAF